MEVHVQPQPRVEPLHERHRTRSRPRQPTAPLYPSLVEGWGIPVTEALALGTPVLTSNTSAMPEAGGDDARYFDPNDVESMAVALIDAIEDYVPTWPRRRDAAMARVRQLTWMRTAEQTLQAYRDAAAISPVCRR